MIIDKDLLLFHLRAMTDELKKGHASSQSGEIKYHCVDAVQDLYKVSGVYYVSGPNEPIKRELNGERQ